MGASSPDGQVGQSALPSREILRRSTLVAVTGLAVFGLAFGLLANFDTVWWTLAWVGYPLVGGLLLWRRPGNTIGRLLLFTGCCMVAAGASNDLVGDPPGYGPVGLEVFGFLLGVLGWLGLMALVVLFPSGRAETWASKILIRVLAVLTVLIFVAALFSTEPLASGRANPLGISALDWFTRWFIGPGFILVPLIMLAALTSLIARWRRSRGTERLQFRWFISSVVLALVAIATAGIGSQGQDGPVNLVWALPMNAVPAAIGIAVTRYRLYDIDRVVSRAVSYGLVTASLLAVYVAVVTSVSSLSSTQSSLGVALATLVAAAVFRPLLSRVQTVVDRRFNRARYDAQLIVDGFAGRLRDEVDPNAVSADLLDVLSGTVQPANAALWLREPTS